MTKTPDEIKKGLECCTSRDCGGSKCPYFNEKSCNAAKSADALALIQQLQAENSEQAELIEYLKSEIEEFEESADKCCFESRCNAELNKLEALCKRLMDEKEQLEAERDELIEVIKGWSLFNTFPLPCKVCKNVKEAFCGEKCKWCREYNNFEWRGILKEPEA